MDTRTLLCALLALSLAGCRRHPPAATADAPPDAAEPDRNPYRNVMPAKIKQQVEETERNRQQRMDELQKRAK